MPDLSTSKKAVAVALVFYLVFTFLGLLLHFPTLSSFFNFKLVRTPYDAANLFNVLVSGKGQFFFHAHLIIYLAVPFLLVATLVLSGYLFRSNQLMAFLGGAVGIIGCMAMAGVVSTWLSFTAIGRVHAEYYEGARAALIELTNKQGFFKWNTGCSYLAFIGLLLLAAGLLISGRFPRRNMFCIILGSLLFIFFMDMDNWMFIATIFMSVGLLPIIKSLWHAKN